AYKQPSGRVDHGRSHHALGRHGDRRNDQRPDPGRRPDADAGRSGRRGTLVSGSGLRLHCLRMPRIFRHVLLTHIYEEKTMSDVQLMIADLKSGCEGALRNIPEADQERVLVNVKATDILRLIDALESVKPQVTN